MSKKKTPVANAATAKAPQKKGGYRVLALLSLLLCVALLILPLSTFTSAWVVTEQSIVDSLSALFAAENEATVFGFLPALFTGEDFAVTLAALSLYVALLFVAISAILSVFGVLCGKGKVSRSALAFVTGAAIAYFACTLVVSLMVEDIEATVIDLYSLIIAIVGIILGIIVLILRKRKAPANPYADFVREEYVEAYEYEGGPVAGIELAEEVFPTVAAIDAAKDPSGAARNTVATLLGNGFDPFLITLNESEKNDFIDLYVLKCRGIMPEIPGYVVGGDNRDFFNKVFIYLGQHREKITDQLLAKMYQYSMKL